MCKKVRKNTTTTKRKKIKYYYVFLSVVVFRCDVCLNVYLEDKASKRPRRGVAVRRRLRTMTTRYTDSRLFKSSLAQFIKFGSLLDILYSIFSRKC